MSAVKFGEGHVYHARKEGADNSFRYPTFFIYFRSDLEEQLRATLQSRFMSFLSFSPKDYLKGDAGSIDLNIRKFLSEICDYKPDQIWLHTLPRMLGYAFNPVSFWLCKREGRIDAVLVEVNNTFGERHFYWIKPDGGISSDKWYRAEKVFHVSPFFPVEGFYQFRFQAGDEKMRVDINYHGPDGALRLATWVEGVMSSLGEKSLLKVFVKYGWITPMVVFRIHYQALKLFLKRSRFFRKPALPREEVSS